MAILWALKVSFVGLATSGDGKDDDVFKIGFRRNDSLHPVKQNYEKTMTLDTICQQYVLHTAVGVQQIIRIWAMGYLALARSLTVIDIRLTVLILYLIRVDRGLYIRRTTPMGWRYPVLYSSFEYHCNGLFEQSRLPKVLMSFYGNAASLSFAPLDSSSSLRQRSKKSQRHQRFSRSPLRSRPSKHEQLVPHHSVRPFHNVNQRSRLG